MPPIFFVCDAPVPLNITSKINSYSSILYDPIKTLSCLGNHLALVWTEQKRKKEIDAKPNSTKARNQTEYIYQTVHHVYQPRHLLKQLQHKIWVTE